MMPYVLFFEQIDLLSLPYVGGKGANLGELTKAGFPVPGGFCVTTRAYRDFISSSPQMETFFKELKNINTADLTTLRQAGRDIRTHLEQLPIPEQIENEIIKALSEKSADNFYAVRSSATCEDLPLASFAGQQDTYLNIQGRENLLEHVRRCWASLFTDRAIAYRIKNAFHHREVYLAVVVQQMIAPDIAGIMFTADPANGNRTVVSIDAGFGLGETLVSGIVSSDLYKVKNGGITYKKVSKKKIASYPLPEGGTAIKDLSEERQDEQVLTDAQIIGLAGLGKKIERHYNSPQDIEFCVCNEDFFILQSRPVTALYPMPDISALPLSALLSFGHVQMATDAMKPLGISVLKAVFPANIAKEAGGRIFIDVTDVLYSKMARVVLPKILTNADEAMSRALEALVKRPDFLLTENQLKNPNTLSSIRKIAAYFSRKVWKNMSANNPEAARPVIEKYIRKRIEKTKQELDSSKGAERIEALRRQLDNLIFPDAAHNLAPYIISGIIANKLLRKILLRTFGNTDDFNKLNVSLPGNITSQMGLELGDLADILRELPEVQEYLKKADDSTFAAGLDKIDGGTIFRRAFEDFIAKYGMRCPGEIDLTNPRWREAPTQLRTALFSHIHSMKSGEHRQRFLAGEKEAEKASQRILEEMKGNYFKAKLTARLIALFRNLGGLREYPKYMLVSVLDECKKTIMAEAAFLAQKKVLRDAKEVYFLNLEELIQILQGHFKGNIEQLIAKRKEEYEWHQSLKPPRVMTSEGEIVVVPLEKGHLPANALAGSGVSAGVAEGLARVILRPEDAILRKGEILVAPHTDPGWTPLFQSAVAIVTEVGGLMTHGAVVAREYGIPAVVGVDNATTLISDGEKIRVDVNLGFVQKTEYPILR